MGFFTCASCVRDLLSPRLVQESDRGSSGYKIPNANKGLLPSRVWLCARREVVPFLEITGRECAQLPYAVKRHLFMERECTSAQVFKNERHEIMGL